MLEELGGDIFVGRFGARQLERDGEHVQAVEGHPAGAVGLLDVPAGGQGLAAVEDADIIQAQKAALKDVVAVNILAVNPPGEVEQQLVEHFFQKVGIVAPGEPVHLPGGPGVDGRIDVAEVPLVGRQLAVGVHIPLAQQEDQLALGPLRVNQGDRERVEGQIPGRKPGVFPFVGHGEYIEIVMGLLMTPELGPRVRLGVVTTDLPLLVDGYRPRPDMLDFCRICKKCAENCPSRAIPCDDRREIAGALRWQIDSVKCFHYWNVIGTDCGRCLSVCPYSHPDTFSHNVLRWVIRRSGLARRAALRMDDLFYGRKPASRPGPAWMREEA